MNDDEDAQPLLYNPSLNDESERLRLGPTGLRAFFRIAEQWKLTDDQVCRLLALDPDEALQPLRLSADPRIFTLGRLLRLSYLIGIYKGLQISWNELADTWVQLPNNGSMFGGQTPIDYMIGGGLPAMCKLRRLIDAWCAGNW